MKRRKSAGIFCVTLVLLCGAACGRGGPCCLHEGIAYDGPCLVNLATGNAAELSAAGDAGVVSWTAIDGASVQRMPGERTTVSITGTPRQVNEALFCADCLALIEEVPNSGYVLADLHNLDDIRLYAIEDGMSLTLRGCQVTAAYGDDGSVNVVVERRDS